MDSAPIELPLVVAAIFSIAGGVITCFFGHKLFKVVLALVGFLAGAIAGGGLATLLTSGAQGVVWVAAILTGILGAFILIWAFQVGVFLVGAVAGLLIGGVIGTSLSGVIQIAVIALFVILGGLLALKLQRVVVGLATALIGAAFIVGAGLNLVVGAEEASAIGRAAVDSSVLGQVGWIAIGSWIILSVAGSALQLGGKRPER